MSEIILVACPESVEGQEVERVLQDLPYQYTLQEDANDLPTVIQESGAEILILSGGLAEDQLFEELRELRETPEIVLLVEEAERERIYSKLQHAAAVCSSPPASEELQHAVKRALSQRGLRQRHEELKLHVHFLTIINQLSTVVNLDQLLRLYLDALSDMLRPHWGCILLYEENMFEILVEQGHDAGNVFQYFPEEFLRKALDVEEIQFIDDSVPAGEDKEGRREFSSNQLSAIIGPLIAEGERIGLSILVKERSESAFSESEKSMFRALYENIKKPLQNAVLVKRTRKMTLRDDLTNAYNRRYFEDYLTEEFHRANRYKKDLSIIFLDLDNLKEVNDTYGHIMGSKALKEVSQQIMQNMRTVDKLIRFGGDEFCLILPETDGEGAVMVGERLRVAIADHTFLVEETEGLRLTGSFGIASFPHHASTIEDLVKMADKAMYAAKASSKNSVTMAEVESGPEAESS